MQTADWIGSIGVTLLLIGYFFHLRNIISKNSKAYVALNFFGATLACIASIYAKFYPFVILEGIWAVVSIMSLFKRADSN
ncbi:MAG: hypothetical protein H7Y00_00020 [Fimbriimonadaceae bacterium]|nr:hypothetical protein [Chitinophagales bacterium]